MGDERSPYPCPLCRDVAYVGRGPDVVMHACARCRGIWLDRGDAIRVARGFLHEESGRLAARVDRGAMPTQGYRDQGRGNTGRRVCPHCEKELEPVRSYANVVIDVCEVHGVYFDANELRAIAREAKAIRERTSAYETAKLEALAEAQRYTTRNVLVEASMLTIDDLVGPLDEW